MRTLRILFVIASIAAAAAPQAAGAVERGDCAADADCAVVPVGCCGCSNGGQQRAVAASHVDRIEQERKKQCEDRACLDVISKHRSCAQVPVCREGRCVLVPPPTP
jgi:hypothetical protein